MAPKTAEFGSTELALIINRLQMPLIARDYIDTGLEPEDSARYAMHEMMSNLEPSMALLCAATTLQEIAQENEGLTYLNEVCDTIIHAYGPQALDNHASTDLNRLAADLDQMIELMDMCQMSFEIVRPETLVFLNIMIPQLQSQIMIVDELIRQRGTQSASTQSSENIVLFPVTA